MNERIKSLALQSMANVRFWNAENESYEVGHDELKKFADLLVKDTLTVLNRRFTGDLNREDMEVRRCIAAVKEHFGVER